MDYDPTAYDCLHRFALEWPCLSLDILRDELGGPRNDFPHSLYMVAGTQAASAKRNYLALVKLSDIKQGRHGAKAGAADDSDDDLLSESDEEVEDPPQMHLRMQALPYAVNRVRSMPQRPGVTALWGEDGQVQVFDLTSAAEELQSRGSKPSKNQTLQLAPLQAHRHATEGYALDWSPQAAGQLATGDCRRHLHVWSPTSAGSWEVSAPYKGHTQSVEDLQWSPTEPNVLASCSVDGTVRIWDTRERGRSMLSVAASKTDVNVISWSRLTTYILASGDDAGVMRVWDLRNLADGAHVANFAYHRSAITSIEWATHENSVLATTSSDGQLAIWDLAVERDPEEEANMAPDNNAAAPDDLPPQLMFVHCGQQDMKEAHWHPQIPGMMVSTAADGFNVFRPAPGPLNI